MNVFSLGSSYVYFLVSDPPNNLTALGVTKSSMDISWEQPTNIYGVILGYVLQLRDSDNGCQKEIFLKCSNCNGTIPVSMYMYMVINMQISFLAHLSQRLSQVIIFILLLNENIRCGHSLKVPQQVISNEYHYTTK